jgi:hypothetical protein
MLGATGLRRAKVAVVGAACAVLAACNLIDPLDPSLGAGFITTEHDDDYGITLLDPAEPAGPTVSAAPTTNEGGNTRGVFWPVDGPSVADQQSCVAWDEPDAFSQQGIALRTSSEDGTTRAITVTKNIWYYASWVFNVHVMDSANPDQPFIGLLGVDLEDVLVRDDRTLAPLPWHLCARVVGDQVSFKVWPADESEPEWMDGVHGGGVSLPDGWDEPGVPGWYVGHLRPGVSTTYFDRVVGPLRPTSSWPAPSADDDLQARSAPSGQVEGPDVGGPPLPVDPRAVPDVFVEPSTEYQEPTAVLRAP